MIKNILFISIIIILLAAVVVYSGTINIDGQQLEQPQISSDVTVRFVNSWGGTDSNAEALDTILRGYMLDNEDITVVNDSVGGGDFLTKIKTDFATNNDPDVFGLWPGSDIDALIEAGKVADLTELINGDQEWKDSFGENAWEYCTVDDRIYGLPVEIIYEGLFVNKEIFEKYNLKMPETYSELCKAVVTLAENDVIPIAYNHEAEGTYIYQNLVAQHETCYRDDCSYDELLRKGMYNMLELYNLGAFPDNAYILSDTQRNELFLNGEAAMIVQGSWFTREVYESGMGTKVEILPFPSFSYQRTGYYSLVYGLGCGTFYISQKAWDDETKRDACIQLLRRLTSAEASMILSDKSGFLSNIYMDEDRASNILYKRGIQLIKGAYKLIPPPDTVVDRDLWEGVIVKDLPDIYRYGESEIDSIWSKINEVD